MDSDHSTTMPRDVPAHMRKLLAQVMECDALYQQHLHDTLRTAVAAVEFMEAHPASYFAFLEDAYFVAVGRPTRPSAAVFMYLEQAVDPELLERCVRRGQAVDILRNDYLCSTEEIAEEYSRDSIMQVLEDLTELPPPSGYAEDEADCDEGCDSAG